MEFHYLIHLTDGRKIPYYVSVMMADLEDNIVEELAREGGHLFEDDVVDHIEQIEE